MTPVAAAAPAEHHQLLRILGVSFGVAAALGDAVGSGILRSPSAIAAEVPAAWLILGLWVLGAIQSGLGANIQAELATAIPRSGGSYNFVRRAFGDVGALMAGWSDLLAGLAGTAAASVTFAEFLPGLWPEAAGHKIAVAVGLQLFLYGSNMMGLREGSAIQQATSFAKAVMLFAFVLAAAVLVPPAEPALPAITEPAWHWAAIVLAYQMVIGAYSGWNAPVSFTGENTAPGRSLPRALGYGVVLTAVLYIGINAVLLRTLGTEGVAATPLPFSVVLGRIGGTVPSLLFTLTALVAVASVANANIMSGSRILWVMAEDRLLPHQLGWVNRGGSPVLTMLLAALVSLGLALSGSFERVFGLIAILNAVADALVDIAYFVLRRREPRLARPWRAVGHPVLPAMHLAILVALLVLIGSADWVGIAVAAGLGLLCVPLALVAHRARRLADVG
jgi:APA family basic amino acid/polyamine antiporter